jgi:hypothetical protein
VRTCECFVCICCTNQYAGARDVAENYWVNCCQHHGFVSVNKNQTSSCGFD